MPRVFIAVGSNIEPESSIPKALSMLADRMPLIAVSLFYRTEPMGTDGASFCNGMVEVDTSLTARELKFGVLRNIESALGRIRGADKYAPRTIDLDICVYNDLVIDEPDLTVPDPDIARRPFVAMPLYELVPEFVLPMTNIKLSDIVSSMNSDTMIELVDFTEQLKREYFYE